MIYYKKKSRIKRFLNNIAFFVKNKRDSYSFSFFAFLKRFFLALAIFFVFLLAGVYGAYIYYFPKITNEENIEQVLNDKLKDFSSLKIDIDNFKIKPNLKLELNLKADKIALLTSRGEKFVTVNKINVDLNLLALLHKKIDLTKVEIDEIFAKSSYGKDKKYDFLNYFDLEKIKNKPVKFKLSNLNMLIKSTKLTLCDLNYNKNFYVLTDKLKFNTSFEEQSFKNSKISLNGQVFADNLKLSNFNLNFNYKINKGKIEPKNINIDFISDNLDLSKLQGLFALCAKIVNQNINVSDYSFEGFVDSKIKLKSDFKKLFSSGFLVLNNVNIKNKPYKIELSNINSKINFNDNHIQIDNLTAFCEKNRIILNGIIDNFANLDLKITTEKIALNKLIELVNSSVFLKNKIITSDFKTLSGFCNFICSIKGSFKNPQVLCNVKLNDLKLVLKQDNTNIFSNEINLKATKEGVLAFGKFKYSSDLAAILNPDLSFNLSIKPQNNSLNLNSLKVFSKNTQILDLTGQIIQVQNNYEFKNFKISILQKLNLFLKNPPYSIFSLQGNLSLAGNIYNPLINASLTLSDIKDKIGSFFVKNANLNIINNNFYFSSPDGYFSNSRFEISSSGKIKNYIADISQLSLNFPYLNLDNLKKSSLNQEIQSFPYVFKVNISALETMGLILNNVSFDGEIKNNIFSLNNFKANALEGVILGDIKCRLTDKKLALDIILKNINTSQLIKQVEDLKDYSIALSGNLNALIKAKLYADDFNQILKTFDGYLKFNIDNGELNQLAKLERFLQAGNILSQSFLKLTLNSTLSALSKQNTGDFKTIEGTVKIKNSDCDIQYIKTQGPNMSLYITGQINLLSNIANVKILGKIPSSIVNVMGEFGKFSAQKLVDNLKEDTKGLITSLGASPFEKMLSVELSQEELSKIPNLAPEISSATDRKFVVRIIGDIRKINSIKIFRWHSE